jgi:hypothetical protein
VCGVALKVCGVATNEFPGVLRLRFRFSARWYVGRDKRDGASSSATTGTQRDTRRNADRYRKDRWERAFGLDVGW